MRSRNLDEVVGRFHEIIVNDSENRLMRASHTIWESVICSTNILLYTTIYYILLYTIYYILLYTTIRGYIWERPSLN